ncbi:MAG: hypothetical protein ACKO6B_05820 [Planctomycetia bacterium]
MTSFPHEIGAWRPAGGWQFGRLRGPCEETTASSLVVLKFGGSLLSRPDWPTLLKTLLKTLAADRRPATCCLVVGGGAVVEGLRSLDRAVPQEARFMHALAIDAMRLTARLVAYALELPLVAAPPGDGTTAVLDVPAWLAVASRADQLPAGWETTSDSIAALVAATHSGRLLLAKSVPPLPCPGAVEPVSALAEAGWVDPHFPAAAASLTAIAWAAPA